MSVGENIRRIRVKKELTQAYVAAEAGISQSMLCQIERGTKNPSLQIGKEIADVLGCKLENLLVGEHSDTSGKKKELQEV